MPHADCGGTEAFGYLRGKKVKPQNDFKLQGVSMPHANCGEQSGDRQRREKALPFLKEEKSEHERAQT